MKRACCTLRVKKDRIQEYLKAHQVWPELEKIMLSVGMKNLSLFMRQDGLVVFYFEAEDPDDSLHRLGETDTSVRWEELMEQYLERAEGSDKRDLHWLEQYYYLE